MSTNIETFFLNNVDNKFILTSVTNLLISTFDKILFTNHVACSIPRDIDF